MATERFHIAIRRGLGTALAVAMLGTGAMLAGPIEAQAAPNKSTDQGSTTLPAKTNVQVIAFQQTWNSIAKECTNTYGPEGVAYVEVSPPQETIQGKQWWTSYQPVSYKLDSKLGTEKQFQNMITQCKAAGVGIIADVVMNQTTGSDVAKGEQKGVAGSTYNGSTGDYPAFTGESKQYPEGITAKDFHNYNNGASISNYTNQQEVQEGRLSSMWDFDTSSAKLQDIQSDYLAKLYKMGVTGFRMDAIKHINTKDVAAIKAQMAKKVGVDAASIYWIQEVIGNPNEATGIQPYNYFDNGSVTQFDYKSDLNAKFKGKIAGLKDLATRIGDTSSNNLAVPSNLANVFVTNWDTARQDGAITYKNGSTYPLANAFMLAYDYGTPRLLSDYKFGDSPTDHDAGAPGATDTTVPDVDFDKACSTTESDWNCEQRWTSTRGMIAFHNFVADAAMSDWQDDGANNIAFSRGDKGFLAINNTGTDYAANYNTTLPDGEYCNVYSTQDCSQTVTVAGGKVKTTVPAMQAVALYAGATKKTHPASTVTTDPSTPKTVVTTNMVKPDDTTLTVWYKPTAAWNKTTLQYAANGAWDKAKSVDMAKADAQGYYKATINTDGIAQELAFTNGTDTDNNAGANYKIAMGLTQVNVSKGKLQVGNPEAISGQTRLLVHYKAPANDPNRSVYLWGTDTNGKELAGTNHDFTGSDCWGKVGEYTLDGSFTKLGVIITTKDWNKFGTDRNVTIGKDGTAEIWIDGNKDANETATSAPADYACKAKNVDITVHYMRNDGLYFNAGDTETKVPQWDLWTWDANTNGFAGKFNTHDDWGALAKVKFTNYTYTYDASGNSDFGLLRRYGVDEWKTKDGSDGDIKMTANALVFDKDGNAKAEVWLKQDDATVYTARPALGASIVRASIAKRNQVDATLSTAMSKADAAKSVTLTDGTGKALAVSAVSVDGNKLSITTAAPLDVAGKYTLEVAGYGTADVYAGAVLETADFDKEFAYTGTDLGASYAQSGSTFKLWAPTARKVQLVTFENSKSADAKENAVVEMTRADKGVWSVTRKVEPGTAYVYRLTFANGTVNDSPDPYAKAAVINGKRSVLLSDKQMSVRGSKRMKPFSSPADAVIAETHIRDFSKNPNSGVSADKRGKYLGMVQNGTTNSKGKATGVDYLKKLGVTHVQIQPFFDYASVDETKELNDSNYNWGYDPQNYNVPEGSYSSNPSDPATRVKEAKQMVDGLHRNGLRVVMDVVYNHVNDAANSPFNLTVPGYYFRTKEDGSLVSNSGCGNDTASERAMMRKYIVDSVTYWAKEYKVDGFRFDLMGLHDLDTMKAVRAALDKIDPSIIIVGEGWDMNSTMPKSQMSIQPNAYELAEAGGSGATVSFFNDSIRDGLKGSVFDDKDTGFVSGKKGVEGLIANNMFGCPNGADVAKDALCTNGNANAKYASAAQVVQYTEIHDNMTLYDKLKASVPGDTEARRISRMKLAESGTFLAHGIPEFQLGQEFARTKGGDSNSYKSGDAVNAIDWDRQNDANFGSNASYVRDLIAIRQQIPALRETSYEKIAANTKVLKASDGVVAYQITDAKKAGKSKKSGRVYVVALNANDSAASLAGVAPGTYGVLVSNGQTYLDRGAMKAGLKNPSSEQAGSRITVKDGASIRIPAGSAVVLGPSTELLDHTGQAQNWWNRVQSWWRNLFH